MKQNPTIKNKEAHLRALFEEQMKISKFIARGDKSRGLYFDKNFKFVSRTETEEIANTANIWIDSKDNDGKYEKEGFLRFIYIQFPYKGEPSPIVFRINCDIYPSSFSIISLCYIRDTSIFDSNGICSNSDAIKNDNIVTLDLPDIDESYLFYLISIYTSEYDLGTSMMKRIEYFAKKGEIKINLDTYISFILELGIAEQDEVIEILSRYNYKEHKNNHLVQDLYHLIEKKLSIDVQILKEINTEKTITDYVCDIIKIKNMSKKTKKLLLHNLKSSYGKESKTQVAFEQSMKIPFDKVAPFPRVSDIYDKLNEKIYGMEGVKLRVCEFLAKKELNPDSNNRILCLVGKPGVGKTYFVNVLSNITNLPFYPIAIGGMGDNTQLKGVSKSYQGSEEGGIIKAMIYGEIANPIILLDEIDKISSTYSGGKAAITGALLEILDPNQNKKFNDQFLDIEVDISKIWFIATANYIENIAPPLLDRLEIIEVPSYTHEDKVAIFDKFLFSDAKIDAGIENYNIIFEEAEKMKFIKRYFDPGIRKLAEAIKTICSNIALSIVRKKFTKKSKIIINKKFIDEVLKQHDQKIGIGFEL